MRFPAGPLVLVTLGLASAADAAGYHEAPFVSENPKVDGTDLFAFRSFEAGRDEYVTLIANYQPLQDAFAGPGYFAMDPDAIYEIHVDNDGDGVEDLTFRFDFAQALNGGGLTLPVGPPGATRDMPIAGVAIGAVNGLGDNAARNHLETYTVQLIRGDRRTGVLTDVLSADTGLAVFEKPLDFIGLHTLPSYAAYADAHIFDVDIDGCTPPVGTSARVFVGQRAEPSSANLGQFNDLFNLDLDPGTPQANPLGAQDQGANVLATKSVTSLALEVPRACLVDGGGGTIGVWSTASVRQARVLNPTATFAQPSREGGPFTQVSRVAMPLVNDLVIGLPDKDRYNGSEPADDALFADYVGFPTWPALLELLFGGAGVEAPNNFPRDDLAAFYDEGFAGVNESAPGHELLRLNTNVPITAVAAQSPLGLLQCFSRTSAGPVFDANNGICDPAGFPNGRRPGDDVVDITMRALMGFFASTGDAPAGGLPFVDGAFVAPTSFDGSFPYLRTPRPGSP